MPHLPTSPRASPIRRRGASRARRCAIVFPHGVRYPSRYQIKEPRVNPCVPPIRAHAGRAMLASSVRPVVEIEGPR